MSVTPPPQIKYNCANDYNLWPSSESWSWLGFFLQSELTFPCFYSKANPWIVLSHYSRFLLSIIQQINMFMLSLNVPKFLNILGFFFLYFFVFLGVRQWMQSYILFSSRIFFLLSPLSFSSAGQIITFLTALFCIGKFFSKFIVILICWSEMIIFFTALLCLRGKNIQKIFSFKFFVTIHQTAT